MISKSDWENAYRDLIADGEKRLEPPTTEDVEALFRGDLSGAEAERVREQLAYYPDIARVMADEQLTEDLAAVDEEQRPAYVPAFAIAASVVIVLALGAVYLKTVKTEGSRPVVTQVIDADGLKGGPVTLGTRGAQTPIQLSTATNYLLKPVFVPRRTYPEYRLELLDIDVSPPSSVWVRDGVRRTSDGSFPADLSTSRLEPGLYQLVLYGVDGGHADRLATYTIRFSAP